MGRCVITGTDRSPSKLLYVGVVLYCAFLAGCISVTGAQIPTMGKGERVVIWGSQAEVVHTTTDWVQRKGGIVIERARLQAVLGEQQLRLLRTPDTEADLFRVGRLIGADMIIFAESELFTGHGWVSLRCVKVDSGQVFWTRMANTSPWGMRGLVELTRAALEKSL